MIFDHPPEDRYFEDYVRGAVHEFGFISVDEQEVIEFGRRYVPLSYHIDKEARERVFTEVESPAVGKPRH
jgi:hypothetical protein